ncbi:MAG: stage IV sporulation protein A [Clostridia bacterium]|nr:stage IV sporulation protein A [Clostridia bacterium]
MGKYDVYEDIAKRTDGDIYLGAVGPVRTGKSTFIRRFTELFLMPNISGKSKKKIATDELPQSADGKTITTTEPKFIPSESVEINLKERVKARVRLIDCVGYIVDGALGSEEDGSPRLVKTPWSEEPIPFSEAAELGTEKVISEHSTVGVVITTDGSISTIPRENYVPAEERAINKLKEIGKPFAIILNAVEPESEKNKKLSAELSEKYGVSVVRMNVLTDGEEKFAEVMASVLSEFPLKKIDINLPEWLGAMPPDSKVVGEIIEKIKDAAAGAMKMKDCSYLEEAAAKVDKIIPSSTTVLAGEGRAVINLEAESSLFYEVLSDACGEEIDGEYKLMRYVQEVSSNKQKYEKVGEAVAEAEETGYGIVTPALSEISIKEPLVVKKGTGYEVRILAETNSMHLIKVGVKATISPLSGTKKQCEEFVGYLKAQSENGVENTNIFGKPVNSIVGDEMALKTGAMPEDTKKKVRRSISKMVNDGKYRIIYFTY